MIDQAITPGISTSKETQPTTDLTASKSTRPPSGHSSHLMVRAVFSVAPKSRTGYNRPMFFAILAMRILTVMFFVGLAGSAIVVLISFWEDGKELFGKD